MKNSRSLSLQDVDPYTGSPIPFRRSTHLIPSPESPGKPFKRFEPFMAKFAVIIILPLAIFALGLGLEIAILISYRTDGFRVPQRNVFSIFGNVSPQFLASFFPTLVVLPFALAWRELDWLLRCYQPYIVLDKGSARAEESLLLDYAACGPSRAVLLALNFRHHVIFWSALTATLTYLYQPLVSSVFQVDQRPQKSYGFVTNTKSIGLSTNIDAFIAAAGYVDSSVLLGLSDPPSVQREWATAAFKFPPNNKFLNGSIAVNTSGIETHVNCLNPSDLPILTPVGTSNFNLTSKSVDGCTHSLLVDFTVATDQYGATDVLCPGNASTLESDLRPVMFWFFHIQDDNTPEAKTVFCAPTIQAFNVQTVVSLNNGSLISCTPIGNFSQENNVTDPGGVLQGGAFNGLIFDNVTNPLTQAQAAVTSSIVAGAIFHNAQQNGLQSTFDLPNGFLDLTNTLYTRHLATSALSIYFLNSNTMLPTIIVSLLPSLKVNAPVAHILAIILILTGSIGLFLQVIGWQRRRLLLLAAPPGTIASAVALTSRSGFGELLLPYDNEETLRDKLDVLRFRLDKRTGAIIAEETAEKSPTGISEDSRSLLSSARLESSASSMSSSDLARALAAGDSLPT